jgi:hypothetical protein
MSKVVYEMIFAETIIIMISVFFPIIFLIILKFKSLKEKLIKQFELMSKICLFIFIANSFITSGATSYNTALMPAFYRDCPFNYEVNDIPKIFNDEKLKSKSSLKKECNNRRCYLINYKDNEYLCNFIDREYEFFNLENENESILPGNVLKLINYCTNDTHFFKCKRIRYNLYSISFDSICPDKSQLTYNYVLSYLFIFSCIFSSIIPWLLEYYSYQKILLFIYIRRNDNRNNSLKETNNTSKIEDNNNNINNNGINGGENNQEFKRQPTEILIVGDNKLNINNINNDNKNEQYLFTNNINNIKEIENGDLNNKNNNNNFSKSDHQLMNNENKNVLNLINKKIKPNKQKDISETK